MVRNVTEKRAHDVPHLAADNSLQRFRGFVFFSESFDEFTEKNSFLTFVSSIAELGLSGRWGW